MGEFLKGPTLYYIPVVISRSLHKFEVMILRSGLTLSCLHVTEPRPYDKFKVIFKNGLVLFLFSGPKFKTLILHFQIVMVSFERFFTFAIDREVYVFVVEFSPFIM